MMKAACLMQAPEAMYQPFETVSGTLTSIGFPCEGEEPCPPCLTIALVTDAKTYYLSTSDAQIQAQLDELEMQLPLRATISGTPFVNGSFDFIKVQSVSVDNSLLPSLCDEWNILGMAYPDGHYYFSTFTQHLTTDTIIGGLLYKRLEQNGQYKGALREGKNRDIYYIPNGTGHEYLLYAFSAGEGEKLSNLWYGGHAEWCPNGYNATVKRISNTTPREFTLEVEYIYSDSEGNHIVPWTVCWTEGIGMADGPVGQDCPGPNCEGDYGQRVLCAYKNGEQVFVSNTGEGYGCYYDSKQDAKNKLLGMWYLYNKEAVIGNYWNEQGEPVYGSREMEISGDFTYTFTDSMVLMVGPTSYSAPRPYTIEYVGGGHWLLTVPGMYDTPQPSDPSVSGCSPITILQLSNQQIIWEYTVYGGDEGPETHHQYLLRNYPYDNSSDTIPLFSYTGDDPGSSTVDPVDPNQVVVTLKGDELTIKETSGDVITYSVQKESGNNAPKHMPMLNADTFQNSVSIELTEEGLYRLDLTNPLWDYRIYGIFNYPQRHDAIDTTMAPTPAAQKIIRNGQLLIRKGEKVYTVQGTAINE